MALLARIVVAPVTIVVAVDGITEQVGAGDVSGATHLTMLIRSSSLIATPRPESGAMQGRMARLELSAAGRTTCAAATEHGTQTANHVNAMMASMVMIASLPVRPTQLVMVTVRVTPTEAVIARMVTSGISVNTSAGERIPAVDTGHVLNAVGVCVTRVTQAQTAPYAAATAGNASLESAPAMPATWGIIVSPRVTVTACVRW